MRLKLSPAVFTIAYCCGYALAFRRNWPLLRYYPVPHQLAWGATDTVARPGPPIVWYGLVVSAALIAAVATLIAAGARVVVGGKMPAPSWVGWLWLAPWAATAYCAFLLRFFFL